MLRKQNLCPGDKNVFDLKQKHFCFREAKFVSVTYVTYCYWETFASATMFRQQRFLVQPGLNEVTAKGLGKFTRYIEGSLYRKPRFNNFSEKQPKYS